MHVCSFLPIDPLVQHHPDAAGHMHARVMCELQRTCMIIATTKHKSCKQHGYCQDLR